VRAEVQVTFGGNRRQQAEAVAAEAAVATPTTPRQQTFRNCRSSTKRIHGLQGRKTMGHFRRSTIGHARAQGVLGVLDPNFVPTRLRRT
jgi:hypothetical protein